MRDNYGPYGRLKQVCRWLREINDEMAWGMDLRQEPAVYRLGNPERDLFTPWEPPVEVFAGEEELVVRAELPGTKAEEVDLLLSEGMLTISGERREEQEPDQCYLRDAVPHGPFRRNIDLPEGFRHSRRTRAVLSEGVLEVVVEGTTTATRRIPIESRKKRA